MFKALFKKKLQEFHLRPWQFIVLLVLSFFPLVRVWFDTPETVVLTVLPLLILVWMMGGAYAIRAFQGDFTNQANSFLEYLPVTRTAVWLVNYLSGLAILCLFMATLFWLEILLFPWIIDVDFKQNFLLSYLAADLNYLFPSRMAVVISCGSYLFLSFSFSMFFVAYSSWRQGLAPYPIGGIMMMMSLVILPMSLFVTLHSLAILPSGLALSPVLLTSGMLFSISSYALFARVPKHITPVKHVLLGFGLFSAVMAALVGQLYFKSLTWRVLDPSVPLRNVCVLKSPSEEDPDLLLARIDSFRSGDHIITLDVENAAFHDLGRGLELINIPGNKRGLLYFGSSLRGERFQRWKCLVSIKPDSTSRHSFKFPIDVPLSFLKNVKLLPKKGAIIFSGLSEKGDPKCLQCYLCVTDSNGKLLRQFEIDSSGDFLANTVGQAIALIPKKNTARSPQPSTK